MAKKIHSGSTVLSNKVSRALITVLICILFSIISDPVAVDAQGKNVHSSFYLSSKVEINPLYSDIVNYNEEAAILDEIHQEEVFSSVSEEFGAGDSEFSFDFLNTTCESEPAYTTASQCGKYMRECMRDRVSTAKFSVISSGSVKDASKICANLRKSILKTAFQHTGNSREGDYIYWNLKSYQSYIRVNSSNNQITSLSFEYNFSYYTTAAQEKTLNSKIQSVLSGMKLTGKSNYYKIECIYSYICDHVDYDYTTTTMLKHTAYAALINGKAVCQGYAALFYRMALEAGVDTRMIVGSVNDGKSSHAWNIAKIGSKYYSLDATWDANSKKNNTYNFRYFLRCESKFANHNRESRSDLDLTSSSFLADFPLAGSDYHFHTGYGIVLDRNTAGNRHSHCNKCGKVLCGATESIKSVTTTVNSAVANPTIKLNATSARLKVGQTTRAIKVTYSKGDAVKSWKTSNKSIATVSATGSIKGIKAGTCTITVKLKSGKSASLRLTVQKSTVATTKLTITSGLSINLKKGKTFTIKYRRAPLTCIQKVTYSSSKKSVAVVSTKGKITAKRKGTAYIKVKSGKKYKKIKVIVK